MVESGLILPPGVELGERETGGALIDNRTGLPDEMVQHAVATYFVENSSLAGMAPTTFQTYANEGSLLARTKFITPTNVYGEIRLARELADRDDDVRSAIGMLLAVAFSDGMENQHPDERTVTLFNGLARNMNLDALLESMYREYLIAYQVTTVSLFTRRTAVDVGGEGDTEQMVAPVVGILPAEQIRTIGPDLFGNAELAFIPSGKLATWLNEYFADTTTAARKAELRRLDPVSAVLFTGVVEIEEESTNLLGRDLQAYRLNPRMVHRTMGPKDPKALAPRPLMVANFALLEAKRLLNLMDYALLQGGMNFIVVAKKGTDERPAMQPEIDNLENIIRRAHRTGVIVGDHRLSFEIITPNLDALLSSDKRNLLGRKIAMTLLRLVEEVIEADTADAVLELVARVIGSDRQRMRRHVENYIYDECAQRNRALTKGTCRIWFPKIVLQGTQFFTDYVIKLRDRGDIPRKYAVEAAGFDWEAGVEQRKRENQANIDETMAPAAVPFSSPNAGPQDNNPGRPVGTSPDNGRPGAPQGPGRDNARPQRTLSRVAGETVKAIRAEDTGETHRIGELTYAILDEYPERELGRVTQLERDALATQRPFRSGPLAIIPVNPDYEVGEVRAVRLARGLGMLLGERRGDGALIAKALCFRAPEFDPLDAEETALRWGFTVPDWQAEELAEQEPAPARAPLTVVVNVAGQRTRKVVHHGEQGEITEIEELPAEEETGKGAIEKGKYTYLTCPRCGLIQDAAHDHCSRCGLDLAPARRAMFAALKGAKPTLHSSPPPPASKQPDKRKQGS
jgi:hypothetical protein